MRLAATDEARQRIREVCAVAGEHEAAGGIDRGDFGRRLTDGDPSRLLERQRRVEHLDDLVRARCDHDRFHLRPSVDPLDAREEGLAAERREGAREPDRTHAQRDECRAAVRCFDEVRVTDVLHGARGAAGGQDRVAGEALEGALWRAATRDGHGVTALGAAFGDQQVPVVAAAVQVRTLRGMQARARPERQRVGQSLPGLEVDAHLADPLAHHRVRDVGDAVVVPCEIGVDAVDCWNLDPIRPGTFGSFRREDHATARVEHHADDYMEPAVVEADRGREHAARCRRVTDADLLLARGHMADERPVLEILAAVHRHARQVLECRGDEVVAAVDADDARVGVEAGQDRVHRGSVSRP